MTCKFNLEGCVYDRNGSGNPCGQCLDGNLFLRTLSATASDGSTASYYQLPKGARELQDLISHRDMNAQIGEIFRACYRMGRASHSSTLRDARKILFYAKAEVARLEKEGAK